MQVSLGYNWTEPLSRYTRQWQQMALGGCYTIVIQGSADNSAGSEQVQHGTMNLFLASPKAVSAALLLIEEILHHLGSQICCIS